MPYVYSTATNSVRYAEYKKVTKDLNQMVRSVLIKGGTNRADKNLFTPMGVVTEVSDDDLEFLKQNNAFQQAHKDGFIRYETSRQDPEKVITSTGMETADGSAPMTPESIEAMGKKLHIPAGLNG